MRNIKECPLNLECKVMQEIKIGDYIMIIGEIVEAHVDDDKFFEGSNRINLKKLNPIMYCPTEREYWTIGEKLGNCFSSGKELKDNLKNSSD